MSPETGPRAEASRRTREAIVAATVRIVAREGVAAVTHRRVATEAGVSLSSTTWHYATKTDILQAALSWTARREVERIRAIADRLGDAGFDPSAWAGELAEWLIEEVTGGRELAVALYRLQVELLDSAAAAKVHHEWGEGLRTVGERALAHSPTTTPGARRAADRRRARRAADGRAQLRRAGRRLAASRRPPAGAGPARLSATRP